MSVIAAFHVRVVPVILLVGFTCQPASAAEIGPPMFDINRQCEVQNHRNARAMSECIVAESEARSELLQSWSKYSDGDAARCAKLGHAAKRLPYSAMTKCLSSEASAVQAAHKARTER